MKKELFHDIETDEIFTKAECLKLWLDLKAENETETETFTEWLIACTSKHGALERIYEEI